LALSHYHPELQQNEVNPQTNTKPVFLKIARAYQVSGATLWRRIKNPTRNGETVQALTPVEEKALIDHLQFLDNCNIPADRETVYSLAHALLHRPEPGRVLRQCWLDQFLNRHP